jgi:hypothetical protein
MSSSRSSSDKKVPFTRFSSSLPWGHKKGEKEGQTDALQVVERREGGGGERHFFSTFGG